jgi:hypothetical protein
VSANKKTFESSEHASRISKERRKEDFMKPTIETFRTNKRFPLTDYNYHSVALDGFSGSCAKVSSPSFRSISRDYFETEEPKSFLGEAAIFGTMLVTAVVPLVSGIFAIIELCRVLGTL